MLLPGTFQAKIEKRDMKVCEPKDNGNCHLSRTDCWRWSGIAVYVYENCRPANSTNSVARPRPDRCRCQAVLMNLGPTGERPEFLIRIGRAKLEIRNTSLLRIA